MAFTRLCVVNGTVSLPGKRDEAGQLDLSCDERSNLYRIYARKTAGGYLLVCELLMFYSFTSKSGLTKIKKSKFHFVQYLKQVVPCTEAQE